jgi:hypothetical protein
MIREHSWRGNAERVLTLIVAAHATYRGRSPTGVSNLFLIPQGGSLSAQTHEIVRTSIEILWKSIAI